MTPFTAEQAWQTRDGERPGLINKCERFAQLTIPKIMLPNGWGKTDLEQTLDYQSNGAQCVNHLTNKFMLTLFGPSRPFFRAGPNKATKEQLAAAGLDETAMAKALGNLEREAAAELDKSGQRYKLYQAVRNVIITGNVLLCLESDQLRVLGLKYYCVKRDIHGKVMEIVIKECLPFEQLTEDVKTGLVIPRHDDTEVAYYRWIKRLPSGRYHMSQWVDTEQLPDEYDSDWSEDELPYHAIAWDLADEADYGTGLVEDYNGALEALSAMSESVVDGAVLNSEVRYLVNPTGQMSAEDLNESKNGDALPGREGDVATVTAGNSQALQAADSVRQGYIREVSQAFLLFGATVRNAERVTAEEIRQLANELETAFGGVYSSLGQQLQRPIAKWLIDRIDSKVLKQGIEFTIITGLEALSRGGDLEALRGALNDLSTISQLPPELQGRLQFNKLVDFVGNGWGVDLAPFLKSDEEYEQFLNQQAQREAATQAATAAGVASAQPQGSP